ncbi:hypothetical protein [Peredibacter starrii]|uniref:Uncharacterized protein n=1 Tax=Peredibacter starrii TaxID=28202 RepID=A0AAX4HNN8_9BACT|nr:hypothetical protein [Peredibacter starrii]WPU64896.1 hypothetical protein SOO65_19560 [Peredibacter starrii]
MYKFFLYSMLMILYLGLAKALSPSELGVQYLQNEKAFSKVIKAPLATAILVDTHATGFLIKTYYQKYRVISGYDSVEEVIVRTSKEFAKKNLANVGLSLYRRIDDKEEFLPLPPGSLYLGNREFGEWKTNKKGVVKWRFNKSFKNFPKYLGWGNFRPTEEFYQQMRSSVTLNRPFYGLKNEFGPKGRITQENFPHFFKDERMKKVEMKTLLIEYFKENF